MDFLKNIMEYFFHVTRVVVQVSSTGTTKRYVLPYEEWILVKKWYYDRDNREDYLLTVDDSEESYTLVRLNKETSELKVWEINRVNVFLKNVVHVITSPVPLVIRFFTAFFLALAIWPVVAPISFIMYQEFSESALSLATRLTVLVFGVFLMFNILFAVFKAVDVSINRYKTFVTVEKAFITDTVAFNLLLLVLFVMIGGNGIVGMAEGLWNYILKYM